MPYTLDLKLKVTFCLTKKSRVVSKLYYHCQPHWKSHSVTWIKSLGKQDSSHTKDYYFRFFPHLEKTPLTIFDGPPVYGTEKATP